jgi:hypothetical protein
MSHYTQAPSDAALRRQRVTLSLTIAQVQYMLTSYMLMPLYVDTS